MCEVLPFAASADERNLAFESGRSGGVAWRGGSYSGSAREVLPGPFQKSIVQSKPLAIYAAMHLHFKQSGNHQVDRGIA